MGKYYVDTRIMEVVREEDIDLNMLAPEMYYEYRCGVTEGIIKESWYCGDNKVLDFTTTINNPYKDKERTLHFKKYGVSPLYMRAYTVPPSWYEEKTEEVNKLHEKIDKE